MDVNVKRNIFLKNINIIKWKKAFLETNNDEYI